MRGQEPRQTLTRLVVRDRRDEDDVAPFAGGHDGRESGAAGPRHVDGILEDRHRCVRREPRRDRGGVHVEEHVADDDQGAVHDHAPVRVRSPAERRSDPFPSTPIARSNDSQSTCRPTRCSSWTVAVSGASTAAAWSATLASGFGHGPVNAHTRRPRAAPRRAASTTFGLPAAGREQDEDVAGAAVGLDLTREQLLGRVVVRDRRERRGLGGETDRRERRPLVPVSADQLGGQVLRLGRAAAVPGGEEPAAIGEDVGQRDAPGVGHPQDRAHPVDGAPQPAQVLVPDGRRRVHHRAASCVSRVPMTEP